ncbi:hypothetical protein D7147_29460 [Micromonospora musae]|uniref:WD40 repeat domain-containing protein n=1 Tax=Micromonospora musae TaxID=1894970 RepID=A0A3A9XWQ0_9ACTN|nr:hypothetical protein [Micromonospora musae]RKN13975.1 hypothetical protein D7147_29460 [Micromonospora musae]RKN29509.1 hypothetical protein D7044_21905 [Micromonospora musae]
MNDQRLRLDLADLAEEVTPVDLRDRALRTSRRIGTQRAVATSAAVVLMLAAATGTAFAILPGRGADPLPATTPSITASPSPSASPTPSVSTDPSTPSSGAPASLGDTATFDRLFYVPEDVTPGAQSVRLRSWRPGDDPTRLASLPQVPALTSASVSPDGQRVAWVEDGDQPTLYVANVDGSGRKPMVVGADRACVTPTWSPDSRHLLFRESADDTGVPRRYGVLDTRSAKKTVHWWTAEPEACHALWSADGNTIAMNTSAGVTLFDPDGKRKRDVPGLSHNGNWWSGHIASIAPNGSRIALYRFHPQEEDQRDVARFLRASAVLDTRTGKAVSLPLGGRELRQVFFQADGSMVVRVRSGGHSTLILVDEDGTKISEEAEPSSLTNMQIIGTAG